MSDINVTRVSDENVQIDLPFARGMRFKLEDATQLRDMLTAAIEQPSMATKAQIIESIKFGRKEALRRVDRGEPLGTGKIDAIKHLRGALNLSLRDAKDAVESLWDQVPDESSEPRDEPSNHNPTSMPFLEWREALDAAVAVGRAQAGPGGRITAIRHLRDATQCMLSDAKLAVDSAWESMR